MIVEKYTDMAGKIRVLYYSEKTGNCYMFKFAEEPSEELLKSLCEERDNEEPLLSITFPYPINPEYNQLIIQTIELIKNKDNLLFSDYNDYLLTLNWKEEAVIKNIMIELGTQQLASSQSEEELFNLAVDFVKKHSITQLKHYFNVN